jgi:hypothetical protein
LQPLPSTPSRIVSALRHKNPLKLEHPLADRVILDLAEARTFRYCTGVVCGAFILGAAGEAPDIVPLHDFRTDVRQAILVDAFERADIPWTA